MNTVPQNCKSKRQTLDKNTLQSLVDEYFHTWGDSYKIEDQWWGDKKLTWEEAIARAWKSRLSNGKMHGHQWRVAHKLPEGLDVTLAVKKQPEDFTDFQSVYDWVKSIVTRVKGLGATTAYDIARRLGAWLRLEPVVVYLHAGTAAGARKFGVKGEIAPLSAFPKEIQSLGAIHAENFLCIYKDQLPKAPQANTLAERTIVSH
ncbi:MAG: hypothetical protein HC796_11035 [Synechococcaceae cyanobacterium RL_1_2]|nr:hypothetical protein [Synechococcaceae cyanobacterium RL_1_2]